MGDDTLSCLHVHKILTHMSKDNLHLEYCKPFYMATQCLSQDFETGCLKLAVVKFLGVQIFKGDHNILIFQP